ncbi:Immune-associated nucleotide-binding protein 9 [Citrus sinensis]|nr:Immune-associated nucleotide-binding protein 9 [Citrus sinensis]
MLAYDMLADAFDEYIKIGESTTIESLKRFCRAIVEVFAEQYLRSPNANEVARLLHVGKERGFPGMLGSLNCMHWKWKNCPTAWAGKYDSRSGTPTIILEAVADYDIWIWHAHFGLSGSNNDINVLEASYLFANLASDSIFFTSVCKFYRMMGERVVDGDWKPTSSSNGERTVVLLGRTGNGKSATGNSILGRTAFKASAGSSGVTKTCEMKTTVLKDGQVVNVIDTPGLFDLSAGSEFVGKEIVKCLGMAKDGIHAFLVVFSVTNRFSQEEETAVHRLPNLFGKIFFDYMIVVFTGGDELEDNDETLEDYLGHECPKPLKEILQLCDNRCVLFDNKTKDEAKRTEQVGQLLSLVNTVIVQNGGQPYTDELKRGATELRDKKAEVDSLKEYSKREISKLMGQMQESYEDRIKRMAEMVESGLKETTTRLEQQLAEEQAARLRAEEVAQLAEMKLKDEIQSRNIEKETAELPKPSENPPRQPPRPPESPPPKPSSTSDGWCAIM